MPPLKTKRGYSEEPEKRPEQKITQVDKAKVTLTKAVEESTLKLLGKPSGFHSMRACEIRPSIHAWRVTIWQRVPEQWSAKITDQLVVVVDENGNVIGRMSDRDKDGDKIFPLERKYWGD